MAGLPRGPPPTPPQQQGRARRPRSLHRPLRTPPQTLPAGVLPPPLTPHLHVHVPVDGDEVTLVLHPPLQLHHHRFPRQPVEEGFGVEGQALPGENKRVRPFPPLTAASGPLTAPHNAPSPPPPRPHHGDGTAAARARNSSCAQRENGRSDRSSASTSGESAATSSDPAPHS